MKRFCLLIICLALAGCMTLAGTGPRLEREFKYALDFEGDLSQLSDDIRSHLSVNLERFSENYYLDEEVEDFVYLDIYFDTVDNLNYQNGISYRLRERFKSRKKFKRGDAYRIEFQAKTDRKELGGGFSESRESRFEFREESQPFSEENLPPERPWDLEEFMGYLMAGSFENYYLWPTKSVVDYYDEELSFEPRLVLVTERYRQHLNLETPWGSGPNPEQAFIISLDKVEVYDADDYLNGGAESLGSFLELELEFERNVSEELDKAIARGEVDELIRESFLNDQEKVMALIADYLRGRGVDVVPGNQSKYLHAFEIWNN